MRNNTDIDEQQNFAALMQHVREGSEQAARELFAIFGSDVLAAVRRKLNRKMRSKVDSQDLSQAVWASFFGHLDAISQFDQPDALVAFLIRVATNKTIDECRRRLMTEKHDKKKLELELEIEELERQIDPISLCTSDKLFN